MKFFCSGGLRRVWLSGGGIIISRDDDDAESVVTGPAKLRHSRVGFQRGCTRKPFFTCATASASGVPGPRKGEIELILGGFFY